MAFSLPVQMLIDIYKYEREKGEGGGLGKCGFVGEWKFFLFIYIFLKD